jgi:predicted transcriptional regulator
MVILLSIKPEYSNRIFSGEKHFEFRKQKPTYPTTLIFIYESYPTKKIVGWFTVKKIISGSPQQIWDQCGDKGGISRLDFFEYCKGSNLIYAFEIGKSFRFPTPIDPLTIDENFTPPQNFSYRNYAIPQIGFDEQKVLDDV